MDVDDLGEIFTRGLGDLATLARISSLSSQMSLFFEGWLEKICDQEKYKNLIYAVYAGGDDLFLIGPWDRMPELAQEISANFEEYTNQHPDIHISGGMAFIGGKYPVYQAADDAEAILDKAKGLDEKNAFGYLERPWKWTAFSEISKGFETIRNIDQLGGPRAIMQLLRELTLKKTEMQRKDGRLEYGPWMWLGTLRLHRMAERAEKNKKIELADQVREIQSSLENTNFMNLDQWGTAARWSQLWLRKPEKEE
jgi:CRISPR-associated protein Csm1